MPTTQFKTAYQMLKISMLTIVFINLLWFKCQLSHIMFLEETEKNSANKLKQKVEIRSLNNK